MWQGILVLAALLIFIKVLQYGLAVYAFMGVRFKKSRCSLTDESTVPDEIKNVCDPYCKQLQAMGFEYSHWQLVDECFGTDYSKKPAVVYFNPAEKSYASITPSDAMVPWHTCDVSFTTVFADGTSLKTFSGSVHGVLGEFPNAVLQDAYNENLQNQWSLHLSRLGQLKVSKPAVNFNPDRFAAYVEKDTNNYIISLKDAGFIHHYGHGYYRMSFGHAFQFAKKFIAGEQKMKALRSARLASYTFETLPKEIPVSMEVRNFHRNEQLTGGPGLGAWGKFLLFIVTLVAFMAAFGFSISWDSLLILAGVIFIHELGHLAAMRVFGYKDTKILFLPFVGAATVGRDENPQAYQKAIVSLMGPVPGIVLAILLLKAVPPPQGPFVWEAAITLLGLNYLNLLPIMPLDGGQLFNLFFSRAPFLQVVFLALSSLALILGGITIKEPVLGVIGVLLLLQIRQAALRAEIVRDLRRLPETGQPVGEDTLLGAVFKKLHEKPYWKKTFAERYQIAKNLKDGGSYAVKPPSFALIVVTLAVYVSLFAAPVFYARSLFMRPPFSPPVDPAMTKPLTPPAMIALTAQDSELAAALGFSGEAVLMVKREAQGEVKRLTGVNDEGKAVDQDGIAFTFPKKGAEESVLKLQSQLWPAGYMVFLVEKGYGQRPDLIALLKTASPYTILRMRQTNGININVATEDIVSKLKEWEKVSTFDIVGADFDWVHLRFRKLPPDVEAFAEEVYKLCPDTVEQGTGTVKDLAKDIREKKDLFLWWD
jgi:Zn-dependent protease